MNNNLSKALKRISKALETANDAFIEFGYYIKSLDYWDKFKDWAKEVELIFTEFEDCPVGNKQKFSKKPQKQCTYNYIPDFKRNLPYQRRKY